MPERRAPELTVDDADVRVALTRVRDGVPARARLCRDLKRDREVDLEILRVARPCVVLLRVGLPAAAVARRDRELGADRRRVDREAGLESVPLPELDAAVIACIWTLQRAPPAYRV